MQERSLKHFVILGGLIGDTPARTALRNGVGHAGKVSCSGCWLFGERIGKATRFRGFLEPAPLVPFGRDLCGAEPFNLDLPETGLLCGVAC